MKRRLQIGYALLLGAALLTTLLVTAAGVHP